LFSLLVNIIFVLNFKSIADSANSDSTKHKTLLLKTVEIEDHIMFDFNSKKIEISNSFNSSDFLQRQGNVFVRTYGPGSISSFSSRGGSTSQSTISWNGIPINNVMLSSGDVSIVPINLFNSATVNQGTNSFQSIQPISSGGLSLESSLQKQNKISIEHLSSIASFGNYNNVLKTNLNTNNFSIALKLYHQSGKNDFPYINDLGAEKKIEVQKNAEFKTIGFLIDVEKKINKNLIVKFSSWINQTNRNISPLMGNTSSFASQYDFNQRNILNFKYLIGKLVFSNKTALFIDNLNFTDSISSINSISVSQNIFNVSELSYTASGFSIVSQLNFQKSFATIDVYNGKVEQNRYSPKLLLSKSIAKLKTKINVVLFKEWINKSQQPINAQAETQTLFLRYFTFGAKAASVSRFPGFNDLYWQPGGNPNLKSEQTKELESNLAIAFKIKSFEFSGKISFYKRWIENQIVWIPGEFFWYAQNFTNSQSKGLESEININYKVSNEFSFTTNFQSNYIDAFNTNSPNSQLIYVPRYQYHWNESVKYKSWSLNYGGDFTSFRYVSWDNKYYLPQFVLHQAGISRTINFNALQIRTNFTVRNIANIHYQIIALRPMPGRNYELSIIINYTK
jgi:vitamin B12 transporter